MEAGNIIVTIGTKIGFLTYISDITYFCNKVYLVIQGKLGGVVHNGYVTISTVSSLQVI